MKHMIIGTAGHVDHGKTLLIKSLTGTDTDRLKEEKKRGITIELGFAHLDFADGTQVGIVDVPGHESFVKNMLMGAGGIDLALLIVAADEGFMPQTVEHLEILKLLGIQNGIIVITKKDLVDEDWLQIIHEDIKERVKGSFLEQSEIVPVSAYTGEGIDLLREKIFALTQQLSEKNIYAPFRLPVDRVFSVDGFGTVVTGTLVDGQIHEGEEAILYPGMQKTKIRNLQVHGQTVETAYAGQRVAINLASLKKSEVERGSVVAKPGSITVTMVADALLSVVPSSTRIIKNGSMVHFFHGSASMLAKVVLLDREELRPGESGFVQLRLTEEAALRESDRFVVRFYSPLETVGGGILLDCSPKRHKFNDKQVLGALELRTKGSSADRVLLCIHEHAAEYKPFEKISASLSISKEECAQQLAKLVAGGRICEYLPGYYIDCESLQALSQTLSDMLVQYHKQNPLSQGIKRDELRQKLFGRLDTAVSDAVLALFVQRQSIRFEGGKYALASFAVQYNDKHKRIFSQLKATFDAAGFTTPSLEEVTALYPKEKQEFRQVLDAMLGDEELILLAPQIAFSAKNYQKALELLQQHFIAKKEITLAEMRDYLGTSRKYALAFLEYCDKMKLTKKQGDSRILQK